MYAENDGKNSSHTRTQDSENKSGQCVYDFSFSRSQFYFFDIVWAGRVCNEKDRISCVRDQHTINIVLVIVSEHIAYSTQHITAKCMHSTFSIFVDAWSVMTPAYGKHMHVCTLLVWALNWTQLNRTKRNTVDWISCYTTASAESTIRDSFRTNGGRGRRRQQQQQQPNDDFECECELFNNIKRL